MDFEKAKIEELEAIANENKNTSDQYRKKFIEVLFYLRQSGRYKENRKYANVDFRKYLMDRWLMSESQFDKERVAYLTFPEEAEKLGPGVVAEAVKKCGGAKKAKPVLEKIIATDAKMKRGIKREKIDAIIKDHAVPKAAPVVTMSDLRVEIARLRNIIDNRNLTIKAQRAMIAEQAEQIDRLKATVNRLKKPAPMDIDVAAMAAAI